MQKHLKIALVLSIVTVLYNIAEGLICIYFGWSDETLALFGFGIDSFVEVISGLGIMHMVFRMNHNPVDARDGFERTALKITGTGFYLLTTGLMIGALINIVQGSKPDTTLPGIIISSISILTMYLLMKFKLNAGKKLNSDAIIADAQCTRACLQLSFVLLFSSLIYLLFSVAYIDSIGSIIIAVLAFREGKESFAKARSDTLSCCCGDSCSSD